MLGRNLSSLLRPSSFLRPLTVAHPLLQTRYASNYKVVDVNDAVHLIRSGSTITVGGFVAQNCPEEILKALGERYEETQEPADLTVLFGGGPGDSATRGINHLAKDGMVKLAIGSHYGQTPMLGKMAQENKIAAYNLPLGSVSRMIRARAANQIGFITTVGLDTMVDPRCGGGKINQRAEEHGDIVKNIDIEGIPHLLFKSMDIDVAILRGTTADPDGNITFERESLYADCLVQAMAVRACRGIVLVQVERVAEVKSINPRQVHIPGTLVDGVVVCQNPENHHMSYFTPYHPGYTAEIREPAKIRSLPLSDRKIIARRATLEIHPNDVVNLGIGMPEGVANVAEEEKVLNHFSLTTEPGVHGGVGASGHDFGPATNYDALLDMNQQFDFYDGGGLDVCFLGMAEVNPDGDVNVTRVGKKLTGPGGFINISQSTSRVNFLGTFTAGGLKVATEDGKLKILQEGRIKKFVKSIPETSFSAKQAKERNHAIQYITERCVFTLTPDGLELTEVAPGIDIEKDILAHMDFKPIIKGSPREMKAAIFRKEPMDLLKKAFGLAFEARMLYNKERNTVFVDLSGVSITSPDDLKEIDVYWTDVFENVIGHKCHVVTNYDMFDIRDELIYQYEELLKKFEEKYYLSVRRYSAGAFTRHKLGQNIQIVTGEYDFIAAYNLAQRHGLNMSREKMKTVFNGMVQVGVGQSGEKLVGTDELKQVIKEIKEQMTPKSLADLNE